MDISTLRVFIETMRRGSFTAVARDRNVDPSSISRAIAALEAELGVRLFQRSTRRLSATEAGRIYFARVEPLVDELDRARITASDVDANAKGVLRATASVSFGQMCIVPFLPEFMAANPDLSLDLLLTDAVVDLLAERIDVAVRLGPLRDSAFVATRLARTVYSVCAGPGYLDRHGRPRAPEELDRHESLLFPLPGYRSRWRFRGPEGEIVEVPVHGRCVISTALALRDCALADMGIALLPRWLIADALRSGALIDIFPGFDVTATDFDTAAWLLYPSRAYLPLKVRKFIDFLKLKFADGAPGEGANG